MLALLCLELSVRFRQTFPVEFLQEDKSNDSH